MGCCSGCWITFQPSPATPPPPSKESERVRALAAEAALQGANLCLFGVSDIDFDAQTVQYTRLTPTGGAGWRGPLPDAVLGHVPLPDELDGTPAARLATLAPVLSQPLPDRLAVAAALQQSELVPHVIPFRQVEAEKADEAIGSFLDTHQRAVLKPAREKTGTRAAFIAVDGADLVVRQLDRHWRKPRASALAELTALIGPDPWIIQKMIVSRVDDGRTFDVRCHTHRDGNGDWNRVRSPIGLSDAGMLFSNSSRGGYQGGLDKALARLTKDSAALADRVRNLGLLASEALDVHYGGQLFELEVVILIDPQLQPWIAGVTSNPMTPFHEFERAQLHIAYALHRARPVQVGSAPRRVVACTNPQGHAMTAPILLGLFHGQPGGRQFRRYISENAHKSGAGLEVIETALEKVREPAAPEIAEA